MMGTLALSRTVGTPRIRVKNSRRELSGAVVFDVEGEGEVESEEGGDEGTVRERRAMTLEAATRAVELDGEMWLKMGTVCLSARARCLMAWSRYEEGRSVGVRCMRWLAARARRP